ncbi:two-component system alkaline phosphatase synthesis response regulator PhoP [Ezakiella coagulans]|uniref:Two-component system alkaline phosphatase synthesis response regulator PhoP n=1 Tax=Ezakiella coagulans TaxID=46507 RepID=A0A2U1E5K1_9FIRM|nr:response regulator transcription factor [Ezakiella coagulans]PVY95223.1 two-component system alkaline phosphatase synthesis response regulator PhoP [Ezakiella coagulans]
MIYIVEDDESIRELVLYALKNEGYSGKGCRDFEEFKAALEEDSPSLVLLDIMLPGKDGISILKWMREGKYKEVPVIMLTAKSAEIDKVRGLDLGADDYVTKPFSVLELMARIRARIRRGNDVDSMNEITIKDLTIIPEKRRVNVDGKDVSLGFKEYELLYYLAQNKGIVLSRDKIMDAVWGYDYLGESRTVDVHIAFLRQKLGKSGVMIKTVRNVGYILEE